MSAPRCGMTSSVVVEIQRGYQASRVGLDEAAGGLTEAVGSATGLTRGGMAMTTVRVERRLSAILAADVVGYSVSVVCPPP